MNEPKTFRKKPVLVEAIQYTGGNVNALVAFSKGVVKPNLDSASGIHLPTVETLEGTMKISIDDWLIRGTEGEFYPCKPKPFKVTFEPLWRED